MLQSTILPDNSSPLKTDGTTVFWSGMPISSPNDVSTSLFEHLQTHLTYLEGTDILQDTIGRIFDENDHLQHTEAFQDAAGCVADYEDFTTSKITNFASRGMRKKNKISGDRFSVLVSRDEPIENQMAIALVLAPTHQMKKMYQAMRLVYLRMIDLLKLEGRDEEFRAHLSVR